MSLFDMIGYAVLEEFVSNAEEKGIRYGNDENISGYTQKAVIEIVKDFIRQSKKG